MPPTTVGRRVGLNDGAFEGEVDGVDDGDIVGVWMDLMGMVLGD